MQEDLEATLRWLRGVGEQAHGADGADDTLGDPGSVLCRRGVTGQLQKGPVGLLCTSVMQAVGRVLDGFRVQFVGERVLDLSNDPIQWFRGQLMEKGEGCTHAKPGAAPGHVGARWLHLLVNLQIKRCCAYCGAKAGQGAHTERWPLDGTHTQSSWHCR